LWVRGDSNTPLYWNRPDKSAETIARAAGIYTGDRFVRDADGFHFFRGRGDDLIKIFRPMGLPARGPSSASPIIPTSGNARYSRAELPDRRHDLEGGGGDEQRRVRLRMTPPSGCRIYVKVKLLPYKYPREIRFIEELRRPERGRSIGRPLMKM